MAIGMMAASAVVYVDDDNVSKPHVRMISRSYLVDYDEIQLFLIRILGETLNYNFSLPINLIY